MKRHEAANKRSDGQKKRKRTKLRSEMDVQEASDYLGVSNEAVARYIRSKRLRAEKYYHHGLRWKWVVRRSDLDNL